MAKFAIPRSRALFVIVTSCICSLSTQARAVSAGVDTDGFRFVVEIDSDSEVNNGGEFCSAVVVTPTWLLTASHCVAAHAWGQGCGFAEGAHLFDDTFPVAVWLSAGPPYDPDGNPVPPWDLTHTFSASGPVFTRQSFFDECSEGSSARDVALIQLDARIPLSQVDPLHPSLNGIVKCRDFVPDSSSFQGFLVGYGGTSWISDNSLHRNYAGSSGWALEFTNDSHSEAVYQNNWNFGINYQGGTFGDSGGALIAIGPQGERRLCGIVSGGFGSHTSPIIPAVDNFDAAADSDANLAFLAAHILDSKGRFMGECDEGPVSLRDIDTDGDLIPDACDICRVYPARTHDGVNNYDLAHSNAPDMDGDGIPDACDNCPMDYNPPVDPTQVLNELSSQKDSDHDGYGDACDICPQQDVACCTVDDDCMPHLDAQGHKTNKCILVPPITPPGPPGGASQPGPAYHLCTTGRCARPIDSDGDGVPDLCDNCPNTPNPNQRDTDGDGVGDACDNCPGSDEDPHPHKDRIPCSPGPVGDVQCDAAYLGSGNGCIPPGHSQCVPRGNGFDGFCSKLPDEDCDGVADVCDSCPSLANPASGKGALQKNCNRDQEIVAGVPFPYIGDACDPTPCSYASVTVTDDSSHGWRKIGYSPVLLPDDVGGYATTGVPAETVGTRHCDCAKFLPPGTELTPEACGTPLACPIDSNQYVASTNWMQVQEVVAASATSPAPDVSSTTFVSEVADLPIVDPVPGHSSPYAHDSTKTAYVDWLYPVLFQGDSELWTHVPSVLNLQNATDQATFVQVSNHYEVGSYAINPTLPSPPFGIGLGPCRTLPCPLCPLLRDVPNWTVDPENQRVTIRSEFAEIDLSEAVSADLFDRFADPGVRWIPVSEPGAWLDDAAPRLAAVTLDGTSVPTAVAVRNGVLANVAVPTGVVVPPINGAPQAQQAQQHGHGPPPPPPPSLGMALSGSEGAVFVVGGDPPGFGWFDLGSLKWLPIAIDSPLPRSVIAAAYRPSDRAIFAIEETQGHGPQRAVLWKIDLDALTATAITSVARHPNMDRVFLAIGPDDGLLVVGTSKSDKHYAGVLVECSRRGCPLVRRAFHGKGNLAFDPTWTDQGVTVPLVDGVGVTNVVYSDFDPHDVTSLGECL